MDSFEAKIMEKLEALNSTLRERQSKMEQPQAKVDLSMSSLGQVQQEQAQLARTLTNPPPPPPPPPPVPPRNGSGVIGPRSAADPSSSSAPFVTFPAPQVQTASPSPHGIVSDVDLGDFGSKRPWLPKLDFSRFDGTDVRIWLDKCNVFFTLYQIPCGFRVQAASMHIIDRAAHWYHSFKQHIHYHD